MLSHPSFIETNERDYILNFAPGEGAIPQSIFLDPHAEEKCFPSIYCGKNRPTNEVRPVKVSYGDIVKSELRNADRRAASIPENIFFKAKSLQMRTIRDQVGIALKKVKSAKKVTAKDVREELISELVHKDKAYKILGRVRGSPPYFERLAKDIHAMIRQLGPATFFITLSAAEPKWPELLRQLGKIVDSKDYSDEEINNMTWQTKCRLINADPITCARYFNFRVSLFIKHFLNKNSPVLPRVKDYIYRVEFQQRGSPHIHMMVWIENSPKFTLDKDDQIVRFIDNIISCNSVTENEQLNNDVNTFQRHRHSHTCKKHNQNLCRFDFPKFIMPKTVILYPFEIDERKEKRKLYSDDVKRIKKLLDDDDIDRQMTFDAFLSELQITEEHYLNIKLITF